MSTNENKKTEATTNQQESALVKSISSTENRLAFVRGESFFDYVERINDLNAADMLGNRLLRIGEASSFGQLLEYMRWKKQEFSAPNDSRELLSILPHKLLLEGEETYPCAITSFTGDAFAIDVERRPAIEQRLRLFVRASKETFNQLGPLSDFMTPLIISDLEKRIIEGKGGTKQIRGLLEQAESVDLKGSWKEMCWGAIIEFCERKRSEPTALIMHPRIMPRFATAMKNKQESLASLAFKPFPSSFGGIRILSSRFIPDENTLLLANFDEAFVFSKPDIKIELEQLDSGYINIEFTHWTNLALKDNASATMKITLPSSDS